jgi:hypothetical protein
VTRPATSGEGTRQPAQCAVAFSNRLRQCLPTSPDDPCVVLAEAVEHARPLHLTILPRRCGTSGSSTAAARSRCLGVPLDIGGTPAPLVATVAYQRAGGPEVQPGRGCAPRPTPSMAAMAADMGLVPGANGHRVADIEAPKALVGTDCTEGGHWAATPPDCSAARSTRAGSGRGQRQRPVCVEMTNHTHSGLTGPDRPRYL